MSTDTPPVNHPTEGDMTDLGNPARCAPDCNMPCDCSDWRLNAAKPAVEDEPTGVKADPDRPCPHANFGAIVDVNRILASDTDPTVVAFSANITVHCTDCSEPFRWTGLQAGLNPRRPMVSPDETELRAPLRPASSDPDFGMGLPGFAITWKEGNDG